MAEGGINNNGNSSTSGNEKIDHLSYIRESFKANCLEKRDDPSFYPLDLVPLFSVDGKERKTPFTPERSYNRLKKEIDRLIAIEPALVQFVIERKYFSKKEIKSELFRKQTSEQNVTLYPLCLFRDDLLPSHKPEGVENYAIYLQKRLINYYKEKHSKFDNESTPQTKKQATDCIVLYLKVNLSTTGLSETSDTRFYPLELVSLFSVNGVQRRTPFSFKLSCQRLVEEINRLVAIQPDGCRFAIEKEGIAREKITPTAFKQYYDIRQANEPNVTIYPLCLILCDLLPDSHKDIGTEKYAADLLNHLINYFIKNNSNFNHESMSSSQEKGANCIILYLKVRQSRTESSETRGESVYPSELVQLFSVNGVQKREPFTLKLACQRLVEEISKLVAIQPDCCQFIIEKGGITREAVATTPFKIKYHNTRQASEQNVIRYPLCLFRDDLLPDSHKDNGTEEYATDLLEKLIFNFSRGERIENLNYESFSWSEGKTADCTALWLKVKRPITESENSACIDRFENLDFKFKPTGKYPIIGRKFGVVANLLQFQNYGSVEDIFLDLILHVKQILDLQRTKFKPSNGYSVKSMTFKIGKSTVKPKNLIEFDSCDINTWDTTYIRNRFSKYRKKKKYHVMVVLCALTPEMVPIDMHVTKLEKSISIQEHFALALEGALVWYFGDNPIPNTDFCTFGQTSSGLTNSDLGNNMVIYLAFKYEFEAIEAVNTEE